MYDVDYRLAAPPCNADQALRKKIRADLPAGRFKRQPVRLLFVPLYVGLISVLTTILMTIEVRWYGALLCSLLLGNCYGTLMFLGHEITHGSVVRSLRVQNMVLHLCCLIFCLPPNLWRHWHNKVHHPYANVVGRDPDNFGTLAEFHRRGALRRLLLSFAPGSGHGNSLSYLFFFFTLQGQAVLWVESPANPDFSGLNRARAIFTTFAMAAFWILIGIIGGGRFVLFAIAIPMLLANFLVLSYVVTNHQLRALTVPGNTLKSTMSVTTSPILDRMHFHFSHHVEHHLFPSMSSRFYPDVRRTLRQLVGPEFLAPPHWLALLTLYRTPPLYDGTNFVNPYTGQRRSIRDVEDLLSKATFVDKLS